MNEFTTENFVPKPRCLHGEVWNACGTCRRYAWCDDCGALVDDHAEPPLPNDTVTCAACVDRMINPPETR